MYRNQTDIDIDRLVRDVEQYERAKNWVLARWGQDRRWSAIKQLYREAWIEWLFAHSNIRTLTKAE